MSVAELSIDEREALADSISPERLAADRAAQDEQDEQTEQARLAELQDISDRLEPTQFAVSEALDEVLGAMKMLMSARDKYRAAREDGKVLAGRARKADVPVPVFTDYATRVLTDYEARKLNHAWLELIHEQIR